MKYLYFLSLVLVIALSTSCEDEVSTPSNPSANEPDEIEIRLTNTSEYNYSDIQVNTTTGLTPYEDLSPGTSSAYQVFDTAYSYAFIELYIDNEVYTLQPIDFVGESILSPGYYSYAIGAAATGDQYDRLSLSFIED